MTLRVKIIFIALLVVAGLLLLLSLVSVVRYFQGRKQLPLPPLTEEVIEGEIPIEEGGVVPSPEPREQKPLPPSPVGKPGDEIISLALPFVERFGSYSNQGNFENLSDLLPFMTDSMRSWAEQEIKKQTEKPFQQLYRGVTTKTLSYVLKTYEPEKGRAEVKVTTQRKELIGSGTNARVYNQDVIIKLMKSDGAWLVDGAFWQ